VGINCDLARKFDPAAASQPRARPRSRNSAAYPEIGDKKRERYEAELLALVKASRAEA